MFKIDSKQTLMTALFKSTRKHVFQLGYISELIDTRHLQLSQYAILNIQYTLFTFDIFQTNRAAKHSRRKCETKHRDRGVAPAVRIPVSLIS